MHYGASMEWHLPFPLINSFNKTEAANFPMQTMLLEDSPFLRLISNFCFGGETGMIYAVPLNKEIIS